MKHTININRVGCWIFGHRWTRHTTVSNDEVIKYRLCRRCDRVETFLYDPEALRWRSLG